MIRFNLIFLMFFILVGVSSSLYSKTKKDELYSIYQKAYGGDEKDIAYDAVGLDDGGYIIVGSTKSFGHGKSDMLITKFDKNGKPLIRATYGGKQNDYAKAVVQTKDGNFVVVGATESFSKDGDLDLFVVKFDKNLKSLWKKSFGGKRDEEGFGIAATPSGGVLVVGYTESYGKGYKDGYILYIDKNGKALIQKAVGGKDDDILKGVALSKDGNFFVVGKSRSFTRNGFDFYLAKFNSKGRFLFKRVYGGLEDDEFRAVAITQDGGCVAVGNTQSFDSKRDDIDVIRYDKRGKIVWHKIFGFKSKEWANSVVAQNDGGFIVAGTTKSFGFGGYDFYLLELNSKGSSIWANVYGGDEKDIAHSIRYLKDNRYLVVGETDSYGKGENDFMYILLEK